MPKGYPSKPRPVRPIEVVIGPSIAYVPLTRGYYALIDLDDVFLLSGIHWSAWVHRGTGMVYAIGSGKRMHRVLCEGQVVDHKNRNGIDCRKSNLRSCTQSENLANQSLNSRSTTGYKGVTLKPSGRYLAQVSWLKKHYTCGTHDTAELASLARDAKARELHGEFFCAG